MDFIISGLRIPVEKDGPDEYAKTAALRLGVDEKNVRLIKILAKSLDISDLEQFYFDISIAAHLPEDFKNSENLQAYVEEQKTAQRPPRAGQDRPIVIGFGPAGIFAALELIEYGLKPLIFERGKRIEDRSIDVTRFVNERILDPESNIQFGEGGAGSFSDGKLFSRMKNSACINKVLETFVSFGAPKEIRYISRPHLGTDVLCRIVRKIRDYILEMGGEIHFSSKMTDLIVSNGNVRGVVINNGEEYPASAIYLATGHSARDTFEMMCKKGVFIEQRPIAIGVRIEHPVKIINLIRHGEKYAGHPAVGAAVYSFTHNDRRTKRGVNTFCMCPGGHVINASSEHGLLAINGMSYSARSSPFSNAALVVTCRTSDYGSDDPLAGIEFQKTIEQRAFNAGGRWEIPAQNLPDFLTNRVSANLNENSSPTGTVSVDMREIFPEFVTDALQDAFSKWKEGYPLFVSHHAILLAAETRTSAPIRIKRGQNFESVSFKNLYPIGEGSGYTGGITSSAADGIKAVQASMSSCED